jgi:hypothetical protein
MAIFPANMDIILSHCVALGLVSEGADEEQAAMQLVEAIQALEQRASKAETELLQARQTTGDRISSEIEEKLSQARQRYPFLGLDDCYALCEAANPELFASGSQGDPEIQRVTDPDRRSILARGPATPLPRRRTLIQGIEY